MDLTNAPASGMAHPPSPAGSTAALPLQGVEEARDFFDADIEDDEPVPQLAANAAARTAVPARPRLIKATPNIRDPKAAKRNSAATRSRTEAVAPAGTFCVLTQLVRECATIQAAHVVPRKWHKSAPQRIRNIEYHLGFPKARSLNLDTRWNILFLLALYHIFYDHGGIMLIPTLTTLQIALKFTIMNQKLAAANKPLKFFLEFFKAPPLGWRYKAVPVGISPMQSIFRKTLRRVERADGTPTWEDTDQYRQHRAWNTLNKITERPAIWTDEQKQAIQLIEHIVAIWLSSAPDDFQPDPNVDRLAGDPEEVEDDHAYRESTPTLPLDPVTTNNLSAVQTPDSNHDSPPMHSSPLKDHAERRAQKRVLDASDEDAPVAGPSKRPRT